MPSQNVAKFQPKDFHGRQTTAASVYGVFVVVKTDDEYLGVGGGGGGGCIWRY
jgi:hypothetical protein